MIAKVKMWWWKLNNTYKKANIVKRIYSLENEVFAVRENVKSHEIQLIEVFNQRFTFESEVKKSIQQTKSTSTKAINKLRQEVFDEGNDVERMINAQNGIVTGLIDRIKQFEGLQDSIKKQDNEIKTALMDISFIKTAKKEIRELMDDAQECYDRFESKISTAGKEHAIPMRLASIETRITLLEKIGFKDTNKNDNS